MSRRMAAVTVRLAGLTLVGLGLAACESLPKVGEAPFGYRAYCAVYPNPQTLFGQNSLRRDCVEVVPAEGSGRRGAVRSLG